jgi:hypothetical protein
VLEQRIRYRGIGPAAGDVEEIAAQGADREIRGKDDRDADEQRHQGVEGVVGDHAVVDDHREE